MMCIIYKLIYTILNLKKTILCYSKKKLEYLNNYFKK